MEIVFRVDASSIIGIGHVMRCLTLADKLRQKNHELAFICRELDGNLNNLIRQRGYTLITLAIKGGISRPTQEEDAEDTIGVIPKNIDLIVVDSYDLGAAWHKKLKIYTKRIMVIDDLADRKFDCNLVLNQNLDSKKEDYKGKVPSNCELLMGANYALLRPEFSKLRKKALEKRKNTKNIKNILISMGGSDINNITYDVLQQLNGNFSIVVVLGGGSPHNDMVKKYSRGKNIEIVVNSNNMAALMFEADMAIGAGGSTSWERCCLGLPAFVYTIADNQKNISDNLAQSGAIINVKNLKEDFQKIFEDFSIWRSMSYNSQRICDGMGVNRVIAKI